MGVSGVWMPLPLAWSAVWRLMGVGISEDAQLGGEQEPVQPQLTITEERAVESGRQTAGFVAAQP